MAITTAPESSIATPVPILTKYVFFWPETLRTPAPTFRLRFDKDRSAPDRPNTHVFEQNMPALTF
jgi:hypothetical protein